MVNLRGQQVDTSHSDGRGINEAWEYLLKRNEVFVFRGEPEKVRMNEELLEEFQAMFPNRVFAVERRVVSTRSAYNRGLLTNSIKPRLRSWRYVRTDSGVFRMTARGRVVKRLVKRETINVESSQNRQENEIRCSHCGHVRTQGQIQEAEKVGDVEEGAGI